MNFGFYTPNFDFCGDARVLAELAYEAEAAGWDGFFIWDHLQFGEPTADPWIALAAMAMRTRRIRIGPLVTPVPRRHIAKLAREVITLDHLSNGRLTLGVGAGFPRLPDYAAFGDETDPKIRAAMLGTKEERMMLVREQNKVVAVAAARSPLLQAPEVALITRNRGVVEEVLRIFANSSEWTKSYEVKRNLVENPKTPIAIASKMVVHLRESDLRRIAKSKNVSSAVQQAARRHLGRRQT